MKPRIGTARDLSRPTLGPVWAEMMRGLGLEPYGWQQYRADVQYELVPARDGGLRLAAGSAGTMVGRQSGKTSASAGDILLRALAPSLPEVVALVGHPISAQHIAFTAQDRQSAWNMWVEHVALIEASSWAGHIAKVVRNNGRESLNFTNGSTYRIVTPSRTGARGMALDLAVIDEALTHQAWLLPAIAPTMAQRDGARSSFGAQLVIISNAGDETAELLNLEREMGRRAVLEGDRSRMWMEWSCDDDDDPLDPAVWAKTLPTLDKPDGISTAFLARQAETMGTDDFAREYLCRTVWSHTRRVISVDQWAELPYGQAEGARIVAVEVDMDRTAAIVVTAWPDGEHVAVRVLEAKPGVDWVPAFIAGIAPDVVVVDNYGPGATLVPALEQITLVHRANSRDVADAAAGLVDAVTAQRVAHTGDPRFQDAVTWLSRRQRGDRWVFDRSRGDVGPIVAASLAVWLLDTQPAHLETAAIY